MTDQAGAVASELTPRIGRVARRELASRGCRRYEDVSQISGEELLAIHGIGPKVVRILREELAERGLALRDEAR